MSGGKTTFLNAVTATGASGWFRSGWPKSVFSIQCVITGSPSAAVIDLEASLDGGTTTAIIGTWDLASVASGAMVSVSGVPTDLFRLNLRTLTGGTDPTVTGHVAFDEGGGGGGAGSGAPASTVRIDQTTPGTTNGVSLQPVTSGGSSTYSGNITTAGAGAGTGGVAVKTSAGQVYGYYFYNPNSTVAYVQFFDVAQATVNLGTTVPKLSFGIPANGGANVAFPNGVAFATAITIGVTTTRAGSTATTSGVDCNVMWK